MSNSRSPRAVRSMTIGTSGMHRRLADGDVQAGAGVPRRGRSLPSRRSTRRVKRRRSIFSVSRTSAAGVRLTSIASSAKSSLSTRAAAARSCPGVKGGSAVRPRATVRSASNSSVGRRLLVDDAVGAGDAQRDLERGVGRLGVGDDARAVVAGDATAKLQTIVDAEVRLEQDDVGRRARDELERLLRRAGGANGDEAGLRAQQRGEPGANGRLGVDDGDAGHARHVPSRTSRLT